MKLCSSDNHYTTAPRLTVDRILVVLKAAVDRNVNSQCLQNFGSFESYGCQLRKLTGRVSSSSFLGSF